MKPRLDTAKIAKALGAVHRGKVKSGGGYFGAIQLLADIQSRLRTPEGGGRPTDPNWTVRRLVGMTDSTLRRLQAIAKQISDAKHINLNAMQVAAILLERSIAGIEDPLDLVIDHPMTEPRKKAVGDNS